MACPVLRVVTAIGVARVADGVKIIAKNKRALHDYHVVDALEVGIALKGTEVKSVRLGKVQLIDGFARIEDGELYLHSVHISPYEQGNRSNVDPLRKRKLLAHKAQIRRLHRQVQEKGMTLIPINIYLKHGRVKVEIGVCRGKRVYDKRRVLAERDAKRDIDRARKGHRLSSDG